MKFTETAQDAALKDRTVIPRWKSPQQSIETYSFDKAKLLRRTQLGTPWIKHLEANYSRSPSPSTANELYEIASLYGHSENLPQDVKILAKTQQNPAKLLFAMECGASPEIPKLPLGDTVDVHDAAARNEIHRIRKLLADNPARPFCWSELARHFLIVGEQEKAKRSIMAALKLAKHNTYLVRAATRLYIHVHEPDRALSLLRSNPSMKIDPWLLAAEIAASSHISKQSRFINEAKLLVKSNHFGSHQISELASAVGTVELDHGSIKRAKVWFTQSLLAPTDNSLAQAQWANEQDTNIIIPAAAWETPASFEAKTLASRQTRNWNDALQACAAWLTDEPFSLRPALMGSYLGFRPESYAMAEQFASAGLRCDSTNIGLLNNRAVARAYQGKIQEAYADVKTALEHASGRNNPHLMATLGLIAFRSGMTELGRNNYKLCISWFSHSKDRDSVAAATLHLLREEMRIDQTAIAYSVETAQRIAKLPGVMRNPEIIGMTELLLEEARDAANTKRDPNYPMLVAPASSNEFYHQASLFQVPEKAKQRLLCLDDNQGLTWP